MNAVRATWRCGQIVPSGPVDWPEGSELRVELDAVVPEWMEVENDWKVDAAAIAAWEEWVHSIEPFEYAPGEEAEMEAYMQKFRQFNLDAVRKQMETGVF